ncbi:uncharacterized protein [Rutidosis leptorrhynchoides]|uniref:uncharacterized protein n=1 Tax=Rutidosis leptorrhynchoides TaxID=125765 RepID=UPI003A995355
MNEKFHPALSISNIKNLIPITLEIDKSQYNSWAHLFKLHCRAYDVIDHIVAPAADVSSSTTDSSADTTTKTALWYRLDALVLQWIYATISNDLMNQIIEDESTAENARTRLQNLFQDNKNSCALYLQRQFNTICLDNFPNCAASCQEIKVLADQLRNVGDKVTDDRMVLQLIAGLNDNFDTVGTYFTQMDKLPSFYDARSKLILEETRKKKQAINNSSITDTVLIAATNPNPKLSNTPEPTQPTDRQINYNFRYNSNRSRGGGGSNSHRGRSNRGRGRQFSPNPSPQWSGYPPWMYASPQWTTNPSWTAPPCPYPTSTWVRPNNNSHIQSTILGPRPSQAHSATGSASGYYPTDLDQALHTMTLNPPDDTWYMDTGATSHMTASSGYPSNHRGYKCYDLKSRKFIVSRNVIFVETQFPFATIKPSSPPNYQSLTDAVHPYFYTPHLFSKHSVDSPSPTAHSTDSSPTHTTTVFPSEFTPQPTSPTGPSTGPIPTPISPTAQSPATQSPINSPHPNSSTPTSTHSDHASTVPSGNNNSPTDQNTPPPTRTIITHSMQGICKPKVPFNLSSLTSISPIPRIPKDALSDPNWYMAMTDEYKALMDNNTWVLVPQTPHMHVICSMWIFWHKLKSDGSLERYKARLVGDGRSQTVGIDCNETFSLVVKPDTIRLVLSISLSKSWNINQLDVKNAFLHGSLNETVYMYQPYGFRDSTKPDHVCLLKRSLYGLKQAPRVWYQRFTTFASSIGFHHSHSDHSLFVYTSGKETAYLLLYVDDIILVTSSNSLHTTLMSLFAKEFAMKDLGSLSNFLGISVIKNEHGLFLSQETYAEDIISRAGMTSCKSVKTPVDTNGKMSTNGPSYSDPTEFRSLAGALQYLTFTRPDISYAVQQICLHMHDPKECHMQALRRIIRYIRGTISHGLQLTKSSFSSLTSYTDADWGGCPNTRRSTSGYCVFLGGNLVSWSAKRQPTVSRSSAEAEYRGVANVVSESCWLQNVLLELRCPISKATIVFCDNVSAIFLSGNPVQHQRTKHIEMDIHFVREKVARGQVRVLHIPTRFQIADIFTKGLPRVLFEEFRTSLNVRSHSRSN